MTLYTDQHVLGAQVSARLTMSKTGFIFSGEISLLAVHQFSTNKITAVCSGTKLFFRILHFSKLVSEMLKMNLNY